ncbi:beta-galactosidase [Clostridium sp. HBUAS56017]|uniref:beta-galactosidase n=1 Tax=Clostridium sp. HBUAS56017 TaxID=2571128 RepID=UPI001178738D|nr:beta-galactosidase [Clostridium sp. HBUAS56017]
MNKSENVSFKNNILQINGEKNFLITADYPYYRDKKEFWNEKLDEIKRLGISIVTFYIPWRHHSAQNYVSIKYFFSGEIYNNSDINFLLRLIREKNMYCIIKPGPFIHAEIKHGGLPDFVLKGEFENILNYDGKAIKYMNTELPNPLNEDFFNLTKEWFDNICYNILEVNAYPRGPIIGIQVGNEGIYCNANSNITDYDFSPKGLDNYNNYLKEKYRYIGLYNLLHDTDYSSFEDIFERNKEDLYKDDLDYIDWGEWSCEYLEKFYKNYSAIFRKYNIPIIANINPPKIDEDSSYASWITRNRVNDTRITFAYTNWLPNAMYSQKAFNEIIFVASYAKWGNIEDNWGHLWAGEEYKYSITSLYHEVIMISRGSNGFNVYNVCSTNSCAEHLKFSDETINMYAEDPKLFSGPYCEAAPISDSESSHNKYKSLQHFNTFLNAQKDLLDCDVEAEIGVCIYRPYYSLEAWGKISNNLDVIVSTCINENLKFNLVDLENVKEESLRKYKYLIFYSFNFLSSQVQQKLINYLEDGGELHCYNDIPNLDEKLKACCDLRKYYENRDINSKFFYKFELDEKNFNLVFEKRLNLEVLKGNVFISTRVDSDKKIKYLFVVSKDEKNQKVEININGEMLKFILVAKAFAIFKFNHKELTDFYIKNVNEIYNISEKAYVEYKNNIISLDFYGDICRVSNEITVLT